MISDVYNSHPLRNTIGLILARRENPEFGQTVIRESPALSLHRDRIFAVAGVVENGLKETPAALASIPLLNQMEQYWQVVLSELNSFQSDGDIGHLSTAAAYIGKH